MKKPTKQELQRMTDRNLTLQEMCDELGCGSINWIRQQLIANGIQKRSRPSKQWTNEEDEFLIQNYGYDYGVQKCCNHLGRKKDAIYQRAKRLGLTFTHKRDEYSKSDLIREYVENKKSIQEIAKLLGGDYWHVYSALIYHGIPIDKTGRYYGKDHHNWQGYEEISQSHWGAIVKGAFSRGESRNIPFEITIEYAWKLYIQQDRKCALTGLDINFSKTGGNRYNKTTASLDRIDSSIGYVEGNCQWVHKVINTMKMALSQDEFIYYCSLVCNHRKQLT
jgi:hypothetical protein